MYLLPQDFCICHHSGWLAPPCPLHRADFFPSFKLCLSIIFSEKTSQSMWPNIYDPCYFLSLHPLHFLHRLRTKKKTLNCMCSSVYLYIYYPAGPLRARTISILSLPMPTIMPGSSSSWNDICGINEWKHILVISNPFSMKPMFPQRWQHPGSLT